MKYSFLVLMFSVLFFGCKPADAPTARSVARSAVFTMALSVREVRSACVDIATSMIVLDPANEVLAMDFAQRCDDITTPAKTALIEVANVIDDLDAAAKPEEIMPKVACVAGIFVDSMVKAAALMAEVKVQLPDITIDGVSIAKSLVPLCKAK